MSSPVCRSTSSTEVDLIYIASLLGSMPYRVLTCSTASHLHKEAEVLLRNVCKHKRECCRVKATIVSATPVSGNAQQVEMNVWLLAK